MSARFSLDGYAALIARLLQLGYAVTDFQRASPASRQLVLRHDVDMTIESAVRMAEVEAQLGVSACYFVLLRSQLYNPFSDVGSDGLLRILSLGHEIGLHFDASLYADTDRDTLDRHCSRECALLESWLQRAVGVVSFHRPAPALLGLAATVAGRIHTYQPRFFNQMAYCSDSRGGWNHGHPLDSDAVKQGRALQLLTHPIWWDANGSEAAVERLDRLAAIQTERFREELARNCQPYAAALAKRRAS